LEAHQQLYSRLKTEFKQKFRPKYAKDALFFLIFLFFEKKNCRSKQFGSLQTVCRSRQLYFLEKLKKNCPAFEDLPHKIAQRLESFLLGICPVGLRRLGSPPLDPQVVTPITCYNFLERIYSANACLDILLKMKSNNGKCSAFVSPVLYFSL